MAGNDDLDKMKREAERRQDNLAADIDELVDRIHPKKAAERWKNELSGAIKDFSAAADQKYSEMDKTKLIGGAVGGVVLVGGLVTAIAVATRQRSPEQKAKKARQDFAKQSKKVSKQARGAADEFEDALYSARDAVLDFVRHVAN